MITSKNYPAISFVDEEHLKIFEKAADLIHKQKGYLDGYHLSAAYLIGVDNAIREHYLDVFDFAKCCIIPDGLHKAWQTGTSKRTTRLLFNLWDGTCSDGEQYKGAEGYMEDLPSRYFCPDAIFSCEIGGYYWQAIKIRFRGLWDWSEDTYDG